MVHSYIIPQPVTPSNSTHVLVPKYPLPLAVRRRHHYRYLRSTTRRPTSKTYPGQRCGHFSFTRGMFRDIRAPQLVRLGARVYGPRYRLRLGADAWQAPIFSRKSFRSDTSHQRFNAAVSNRQTVPQGEFSHGLDGLRRCHASDANLGDQLRQHDMSQ